MTNPCISIIKDKTIVFSDKNSKSEFIIKNDRQHELEKHRVDDCLIKGNEFKKCDWLAIISEKLEKNISRKEIYIELKGNDVPRAIDQITASVEKLSKNKKAKKLGYVICTRSPLSSAEIQIKTKQVLQSHKLILRVKTIQHTETVEKLIADLTN